MAKKHTSPNYFHQNCEIIFDLKTNIVLHNELPSFQQQFCLWDKYNSDFFSRLVHCAHALFYQEEACLDGIPQSQNLCRCSFPFGFPLIYKSCNLSLKLTEPAFKPVQQQQPKTQSVFYLYVKTASFWWLKKLLF